MPGSENSTAIMFYYVYILENKENDTYIGYTNDLRKRLQEHNRKKNRSTKQGIPWRLIHYEAYRHRKDVMRREKYLKANQGNRLLKRMLKEYFYSRISTNLV